MGDLANRLDRIEVRVRAPAVDLEAVLINRREFRLIFGESVYQFIDEHTLRSTIAGLARLLYAGWLREYRSAIDSIGLEASPTMRRDEAFDEECRVIEVRGRSSDGRVTLSSTGMREFRVDFPNEVLREIDENEFSDRVSAAAADMVLEYQVRVQELKIRYYG